MSKINDLIKEMCPNGVEYKLLKDVSEMKRGQSIITKNLKVGKIPVIAGGQEPSFYNDKYNMEGETITVSSSGAYAGFLNYWNEPILCTDSFSIKAKKLNMRYLYHYLKMKQNEIYNKKRGAGIPHVHISDLEKFKIPCPPLEVQGEIVRILDKFGELEAELEARKSQYEFWRGTIISNSNGKDGKLIELLSGPITDGPHTTPKFVSEGIPFISASAVHEGKIHLKDAQGFITKEFDNECSRKYKPRKWDVYMVKSGSTTGKVAIVDIDADFNIWSPLAAMRTDNEITSRYLYHLLQTKDVREQVRNRMSHGSQPNLSMRVLEQFDVKIPTLEEQHCIVNILDKFDKLINDISEGLPAEIELRRKQYEYYRNKLLNFEDIQYE